MADKKFSKIILNGETLMDVTQDTVDASNLLSPKTATKNSGEKVTGSIATKTSSDLTVSGQTVSVPAGYYSSNASKAVSTMTLPTAASGTSSGTNKATIGRSTADRYINIPTGYNTTAANYKISAVANGTVTAPSSISGTSATVSTGTNTLTLSKTVSVTPSVTTEGYVSAGTAGNVSVSLTANVTTKGAATYGLSTSDSTIASGTYLTGAQTIKGITGGTYTATSNSSGIDIKNYSSLTVAVPSDLNLQDNKTVTPTVEELTIIPDTGYNGLAQVTINGITTMTLPTAASGTSSGTNKATIGRSTADRYINIPTGYNTTAANYKISAVANGSATTPATTITTTPTISIDADGLITASNSKTQNVTPTVTAGYVSAGTSGTITVAGSTTSQLTTTGATTITPTESSQTAVAKNVYTTGAITVAGITSTYVGSGITGRSSADLTVSGQTVTAPAGYYSSAASKAVSTMTLPTALVTTTPSGTNKLTVSRSTGTRYLAIPAGYNTAAAYYTISGVANGSVTAPSSISGTSATLSTGTNTLTLTKTISVTPSVTTAGYISAGTAGNASVSLTANVTTKAAATITPGTTNQTIAAGTYLTGAQTIAGDADLKAENIAEGITIFGIEGTHYGGTDTSDATAAASDILASKTAYVATGKVTGTIPSYSLPTATSTTRSYTNQATFGRSTSTRYINIPSGYYGTSGSYTISAVANGSATTPTTSLSITPTISIDADGLITASGSSSKSVTPTVSAGYVSTGISGTVSASASNTYQMTVQGATTYGLSTEDAEIASGTYLTGKQTIKGVTGGTYTATSNQTGVDILNYSTLNVQVPSDLNLQSNKNATPSTSQIIVTPDTGYNGLAQVTIAGITTMTLPTGTTTTSSGTNKATIGRSTGTRYINIPAGYNSSAAYYTISAVANGSATNSGTASGTAATVSTGTNTLTLSKAVSITPTVTAGYVSAGTAGNVTVSLTANITTKAAATITPGTSNQTIAAGTYLTGAQTISGDADLTAANIKSGVGIFGVTGTYTSDGTVSAADIVSGKIAYSKATKITGTYVKPNVYKDGNTLFILNA